MHGPLNVKFKLAKFTPFHIKVQKDPQIKRFVSQFEYALTTSEVV